MSSAPPGAHPHGPTRAAKVKRALVHGCSAVFGLFKSCQVRSAAFCCPRKVRFLPVNRRELDDAKDTIRARALAFTPPPYKDLTRIRKCTVNLEPGRYEFIFQVDDMYELSPGRPAVPPKVNKVRVTTKSNISTTVPGGGSKPKAYSIIPVVFTYVGVGYEVYLLIRPLKSKDRFKHHRMRFDDEEDYPSLGAMRSKEEHPKHRGGSDSSEDSSLFYEFDSDSSDDDSDSSDDDSSESESSDLDSFDSELDSTSDDDESSSSFDPAGLKFIDRFDTHASLSSTDSGSSGSESSSADSSEESSASSMELSSSTSLSSSDESSEPSSSST